MLLVIDIGNTNTVLGVFQGDILQGQWRLTTSRFRTSDEYGIMTVDLLTMAEIKRQDIHAAMVSCVVPPALPYVREMLQKYFHVEPGIVDATTDVGMPINYERPFEVGADRIVNAVAAREEYKCPLIIVDFGTAITFCAVNSQGEYLGGLIFPGISVASDALFQRTAKLPRVELTPPNTLIGRTTVDSLKSGLYYGYLGMVDAIVARMKKVLGGQPDVISTGGFAHLFLKDSTQIIHCDPYLTLKGLRILYHKLSNVNADQ